MWLCLNPGAIKISRNGKSRVFRARGPPEAGQAIHPASPPSTTRRVGHGLAWLTALAPSSLPVAGRCGESCMSRIIFSAPLRRKGAPQKHFNPSPSRTAREKSLPARERPRRTSKRKGVQMGPEDSALESVEEVRGAVVPSPADKRRCEGCDATVVLGGRAG